MSPRPRTIPVLTIITQKRPLTLYVPPLEDVARVFKRIKRALLNLPQIDQAGDSVAPSAAPFPQPIPPANVAQPALAHGVPQKFTPVLKPPFEVGDFFCDVQTGLSDRQKVQLDQILQCYPPPMPPLLTNANDSSGAPGAMVPIIYPPLPSIKRDSLMLMPKNMADVPEIGEHLYPVIPPLPFPPTSYMPYPLVADLAPLVPSEVFALWLRALSYVPRVDMVLASAAGSIFDIHLQAVADGLTVQKLDQMASLAGIYSQNSLGNSPGGKGCSSKDEKLKKYLDFARKVDTTDAFDPFLSFENKNSLPVQSTTRISYIKVSPRTCVDGVIQPLQLTLLLEYSARNLTHKSDYHLPERIVSEGSKGLINALGSHRDKRRTLLKKYVLDIESEALKRRRDLFNTKKRRLLKRLEILQSTKIHYDNTNRQIDDEELSLYIEERQLQMDGDLLRLKIQHTYDKLKVIMAFYQTSHRLYKNMNATLLNKIRKLKNFLEHQRQALEDASGPKSAGEGDVTNIKNRESAKLYCGFVEQDYAREIKEMCRSAFLKEDGEKIENDVAKDPADFSKVYLDHEHEAVVEDYMPLVTETEFKLITGEAPSKTGLSKDAARKTKVARHLIFQNPLYDYGNSGSDSNLLDGAAPVKRRPGRRAAPKPAYGEESTKQLNYAALAAKIIKLFVGPAGASADELLNDLGLIGIKTRWPLK